MPENSWAFRIYRSFNFLVIGKQTAAENAPKRVHNSNPNFMELITSIYVFSDNILCVLMYIGTSAHEPSQSKIRLTFKRELFVMGNYFSDVWNLLHVCFPKLNTPTFA